MTYEDEELEEELEEDGLSFSNYWFLGCDLPDAKFRMNLSIFFELRLLLPCLCLRKVSSKEGF